jgi:nucleoid-associated protein YgaU
MSKLERSIRFVVGLALVVMGVSVATPFVLEVVAANTRSQAATVAAAVPPPPAAFESPFMPAGYATHSIPDPRLGGWEHQPEIVADVPPLPGDAALTADGMMPADYAPPPPPAPLPPVAADMSRSTPRIDAAYRSTLDVPPPPLLDADSPPPLAVAWSANDAARAGRMAAGGPPSPPPAASSVYVVRDGDDLTGIATRIYGNPAAADVIWSVNRDRLTDPSLLPIGMELRIPPAWSVPTARSSAAAGAPLIEPVRRPGSVRVGPGETLETLAQRFYGDRTMATRLWEANRDRLRSPALVTAGMELRLP